MKREGLLNAFWAFFLSSLLAAGAAGCLATAFGLAFTAGMLWMILLACGFFSLWRSLPRGRWACLAALALGMGLFWQKWNLPLHFEALVWHISRYYDNAYGWGTANWSGQSLYGVSCGNALIAAGCLVGLIAAVTVCDGWPGFPALIVSALPLAACMVVTDTVPASRYLFLLMLGFLLLLITQPFRRKAKAEGNRLAALAAAPLALALALLFLLVPRQGYTPPSEDTPQRISAWFQELGSDLDLGGLITDLFTGREENTVNLQAVGPMTGPRYAVLEVTAAQDGPLYLRGQAYDTYDGKSWSKSEGAWVLDGDYDCGSNAGTIHIATKTAHDVFYMPYNMSPADANRMEQGQISNPTGIKEYDVEQWEPGFESGFAVSSTAIALNAMEQYLQLPESTREAAWEYLQLHLGWDPDEPVGLPFSDSAEAIADLVRSSATYSLRTSRMPAGEEDFAMWFLNESDTGYCVHFATATAVLLRAAGIPARYVTGYLADGVAGKAVTVLGGDAHAWVEYWLPGFGWKILESTASGGTSPVPSAAPEETAPRTEATTIPANEDTPPEQTGPSTTRPGISPGEADQPSEKEAPPDLSRLWKVLQWVLIMAAAASLILGQRHARLCLRDIRRRRGSANEQVLYRWRETEQLCRILNQAPPDELLDLARKAKFSQHPISPEELAQFDTFRAGATARLRERPWYWQILYRLVLALY